MGYAQRGLGARTLALLCYEKAAELAPRDEEVAQRRDAAAALVEPGERIDGKALPRQDDSYKTPEIMQHLVSLPPEALEDTERMEREINSATRKLLGLPPNDDELWTDTPRGHAMATLRPPHGFGRCRQLSSCRATGLCRLVLQLE